jgi:hypothetical protein
LPASASTSRAFGARALASQWCKSGWPLDPAGAGKEGAFLPCSFWLLEALLRLGRREDGLRLFEQVLGLANDLLLLPEEIDPATGAYLGNYPLALSQAGLVHAVIEVQKVLESKPADGVDITDHSRRIGNPTAPRVMSGS